ncbi:MAG: hypothetical protein H0V80_08115 [Acidobacteria bacterium]|nr:hypothetical protein [Acidobacteriota bacterium]
MPYFSGMDAGRAGSGVLDKGLAAAGVADVSLGAWLVTTTAPPKRTAFAPPAPLMLRAAQVPSGDLGELAGLDRLFATRESARSNQTALRSVGHSGGATAAPRSRGRDSAAFPARPRIDEAGAPRPVDVDVADTAPDASGPAPAF